MNILILNLTRFGDLLQTQPVISGLAREGHRVGLVCLDNFSSTVELLNDLDVAAPLPGAGLLSDMDTDWRAGLARLSGWRSALFDSFRPDIVLNLTANTSVRVLARYLAGDRARLLGFGVDEDGFGTSSGPWCSFLLSSTSNRGCSPFNIVDQFCQVAELAPGTPRVFDMLPPQPSVMGRVSMRLEQSTPITPTPVQGYVALQLGASEDRRRYPVASFAQVGDALWRDHGLMPVLLGSGNETHLAEKYAGCAQEPFISLAGQTSLPELAAVLRQARLLVTNDTGTMHLAAGLGTPIVSIFLATAQPWDTGPYRAGALCVEPDLECHPCAFGSACPRNEQCRSSIAPETMLKLATSALTGQEVGGAVSDARVWRSVQDEGHWMNLQGLTAHEHTDRTRWIRFQRHFYSQFLDGGEIALLPAESAVLSFSDQARDEIVSTLTLSVQMLHLMREQGMVLMRDPIEMVKKKFLATWQRLQVLWEQSPWLNVLGYLWMSQTQEQGNDLANVILLTGRYEEVAAAMLTQLTASGSTTGGD